MRQTFLYKGFSYKLIMLLLCAGLFAGLTDADVRVERTTFTANGYNESVVHIDTPGRYSFQTHSEQGTRIELVDWMAGPMYASGQVGEQDGRLDVLLDVGSYKVRMNSHVKGSGELRLSVLPFQEVQAVERPEDLPVLNELQLHSETLGDLLQQSFWVYFPERQVFRLEALGRNLKECRLWLDGEWLVDASPSISTFEPVSGQPMTYAEFFHDLNAGLYKLTCYGGEPLAWAEEASVRTDDDEHPFYVRMGIPDIGTVGQRLLTVSPFGRDTFVVSGETDFFELSRKEKKDTILRVGTWNNQDSRYGSASQAEITKESRDPWCTLQPGYSGNLRFVTVQAAPGDRVMLQYFINQSSYNFSRNAPRSYWVSNHSSKEATDAVDMTAILARYWRRTSRVSVEEMQVLDLSAQKAIARKVNLLGEFRAFLYVHNPGTYIVQEDPTSGAKGRYRLEPLLFSKPRDYRAPEYQLPETDIELTEGFYVLSVIPDSMGVVSFVLREKHNVPMNMVTTETTAEERLVRQRLLWPNLQLASGDDHVLTMSPRHGVVSGFLVRALPLDLHDPLPVTLLPNEQVPIQIEVKESSILLIESDTNASYRISGYGDPIMSGATLLQGRYTLSLKNTSKHPALFSVKTVPTSVEPPLSRENLARRMQYARQVFPTLTEAEPVFEDFDRREKRHYTLLVEHPGLYRLETSRRLATSLTVRTRFTTSLFAAEQNGIGRNALVQQYLRPGEYQVTVQTLGQSKGRAGIHLRRVPLTEEAGLAPGTQKKIHLLPDEAVRYRFDVTQDGEYQLRTLGLNKTYAWRLEDHEGWPLVKPNQTGLIQRYFASGTYHYFSLPDDVEGRRVTALEQVPAPRPELQGKGPHALRLNESIDHVWREEEGRPPDRFVIFFPDPVKATVSISEDMVADLYACRTQNPLSILSKLTMTKCQDLKLPTRGGEDRTFEFQSGYFEFQVRSIDETDRLPYSLRISTTQLITGLRYDVSDLPAEFTVRTGDDSLVELFSFGTIDVKAALIDSDGNRVATDDDTENDWNFRISQKLQPGTYTLRLQPVGDQQSGSMDVAMTKRTEVEFPVATFPFVLDAEIGNEVGSVTFTTDDAVALVRIKAEGNGLVKLALFREARLLAESDRELWLPLQPSQPYTLVFWRTDDAEGLLTLHAEAFPAQDVNASSAPLTLDFSATTSKTVALKLMNADKQSYILKSRNDLWFSPEAETPFIAVTDVPVVMPDASGWVLMHTDPGNNVALSITPFALKKDTEAVALEQSALPFDIEQTADVPVLLEITSIGATVGAVVADQGEYDAQLVNWPGMWRASSSTLIAFSGAGTYRGRIWNTTGEPVKGKVLLTRRTFLQATHLELHPSGQHEGRIPAGEAHIFPLEEASQIFDLLLSKDLMAFVWNRGKADAFAAAVEENRQQRISVSGGELIVLNTGTQTGLYRIEKNEVAVQAAVDTTSPFDPETGFEQVFRASGKLVLDIPASDAHLFVAGDSITSRFLRTDGRITEGKGDVQIGPSPGGLLEVSYEPGYVRVWQSTPEQQALDFVGAFPAMEPDTFEHGLGTLRDAPQRWFLSLTQPQYIVVEAGAPGITALVSQEQVLATSVGSANDGRQLRYFLQPGDYQLWTRPLQDVVQQGNIRMQTMTPYDLDAAMLKPWLIQTGEIQVFRFEVTTASTVGVGVETESDRLDAELRDQQFQLIADGPLLLKDLDAGEYLFIVQTSLPDASLVQYRPVVYGHHGSDQGIPDDVLKEYQQLIDD